MHLHELYVMRDTQCVYNFPCMYMHFVRVSALHEVHFMPCKCMYMRVHTRRYFIHACACCMRLQFPLHVTHEKYFVRVCYCSQSTLIIPLNHVKPGQDLKQKIFWGKNTRILDYVFPLGYSLRGFVRRGCVESSVWYIYMDWGYVPIISRT